MTIIEYALKRLDEEIKANEMGAANMHIINYWRAYLDGAKAQYREDNK